jgi:hypothetical protein
VSPAPPPLLGRHSRRHVHCGGRLGCVESKRRPVTGPPYRGGTRVIRTPFAGHSAALKVTELPGDVPHVRPPPGDVLGRVPGQVTDFQGRAGRAGPLAREARARVPAPERAHRAPAHGRTAHAWHVTHNRAVAQFADVRAFAPSGHVAHMPGLARAPALFSLPSLLERKVEEDLPAANQDTRHEYSQAATVRAAPSGA